MLDFFYHMEVACFGTGEDCLGSEMYMFFLFYFL